MAVRSLVIVVFALLAVFLFGNEVPLRDVSSANDESPAVVVKTTIENAAITPVTSRFILRSITEAEERRARCIIIVLDTPGGLVESTRDIVKGILHSRVPVVVYVAPTGARAASAGVFITMAGHVAAMAPGTNIGAAHPVAIGGMPGQPSQPQESEKPLNSANTNTKEQGTQRSRNPMEDKIVNDTVAWVRGLAEMRGRNADWAESTVKESISVTAAVAVEQNAVDLVATDIDDLLAKINGREIKLLEETVLLDTAGAAMVDIEMWWGERVLAAIANPTIAFLLLIFGFYGILFEFYSPGWGVSGTVGIICLVLGFFAMAILPINYIGLALILIALAMFVAEVFVVSYGFLTIGGAICLIFGGLMLVDSPDDVMQVPLWLLLPISLATAAVSFFLVGSIVKTHRKPSLTGADRMAGTSAVAIEPFHEMGGVFIGRVTTHGEIWNAVSNAPVEEGQKMIVEGRDGLLLRVRPGEPGRGHEQEA